MSNNYKNMSFRLPGKIFKKLKIKLIKKGITFQKLIRDILEEYLKFNLDIREIDDYKNPIDKKLLKKTLTFRIDEKAYKEIKLKLIRKDISFQEEIEKFILAYLDDNLFLRDGGRI